LPTGEQWTYELKLDGFRIEAVRTEDRVILYSKQGKPLTGQFMQIALELEKLPPETALDGELAALDKSGVPRFNLLQNYCSGSAHLMYFAFDVLAHRGKDVTKQPLSERRKLLRSWLTRGPHVDLAAWSSDLSALEQFAREKTTLAARAALCVHWPIRRNPADAEAKIALARIRLPTGPSRRTVAISNDRPYCDRNAHNHWKRAIAQQRL
jgi:bifunctional non-homologous end joining protein LigD